MRKTFLISLVLLLAIKGYAQNDHLEPFRNINSYDEYMKQYVEHDFALLYSGMNARPYARYATVPSFMKEYAFSVEQITDGYCIISNTLSESLWSAADRNAVKVIPGKITIDKQLFQLIGELFMQATGQIKSAPMLLGLDGATYYFSTTDKNGNVRIGEKWSPSTNSLMDRLVEICDKLYALSVGDKLSIPDIKNDIRKLTTELKAYGKKYNIQQSGK